MQLKAIGIVHSPYKNRGEAPRQGRLGNALFELEIFPEFCEGLKGIDDYSHLIVLFWCDRTERNQLLTTTHWDERLRGVFSTRSPDRPNPIAFDIVDLISRDGNRLLVTGMDALDESALLDIKPYYSDLDCISEVRETFPAEEKDREQDPEPS